MSNTITDLLAAIDMFCREHDMAETTFGRLAVNSGKFVPGLREGRGVTLATVDRVHAYMAAEREKSNAAKRADAVEATTAAGGE